MNAHAIARTGTCRAHAEHLLAANEPYQPEDDVEDEDVLPCPECDGSGRLDGAPCGNCDGAGAFDSSGNPLKGDE
jgi:hypothetical protein